MGSDCISSWSLLIFLLCISELLWLCRVVALKSLPVHSFNALIIPILRGCLQSLFNIPVPWYFFDTVLKVTSWLAFVSRCICLPRAPFVNCRQFMYLVISLLVLRAGYGIWLYQFLIIAYLFTLRYIADKFEIPTFSKSLNSEKYGDFFFFFCNLIRNLLIIPYQLIKFQAPCSNTFRDTLLTSLKCPNFQRAVTLENNVNFF